jgi:Domain of unknown function (DUF5615)
MRLLIDANLPRAVIAVQERVDLRVEFARDVGLNAASGGQVAARARESDAALLTRDMDFADVRRYPPPVNILALLQRLIGSPSVATVESCTVYYRTQKTGDRRWPLTHALIYGFPLEIESESIALHPCSGCRSRHSYERPCYARRIEQSRLNRYRHSRRRNHGGSSRRLANRLGRTRRCAAR